MHICLLTMQMLPLSKGTLFFWKCWYKFCAFIGNGQYFHLLFFLLFLRCNVLRFEVVFRQQNISCHLLKGNCFNKWCLFWWICYIDSKYGAFVWMKKFIIKDGVIKDEGLVEEKFILRNDPGSPLNICTNNRGCLPLWAVSVSQFLWLNIVHGVFKNYLVTLQYSYISFRFISRLWPYNYCWDN